MTNIGRVTIGDFETAVWSRDYKKSLESLANILGFLTRTGGQFDPDAKADQLSAAFPYELQKEAATRIAAAIAELFSDPGFKLTGPQFRVLLASQRWMSMIFSASSFENSDFVLRRLGYVPTENAIKIAPIEDLFKLCLLYSAESSLGFDFQKLFSRSPPLACGLGIAVLANRLAATPKAHHKREILLKWMTEALERLDTMDGLPVEILIDVWMHCSYADDREKHAIKRSLNALIRKHLKKLGHADPKLSASQDSRKTVFVILEWFHKTHSIMRTHSISMRALKSRYRLVGFGPDRMVDDVGKAIFDEFHTLGAFDAPLSFIPAVLAEVKKHKPVAVYYPSVGMGLHSIFLINLRLAPKQIFAVGHPATTHSDKIDFVLVEEDFIGDKSLFSEKVVALPKKSLPHAEPYLTDFHPAQRLPGEPVRVAVPTALMKLNPRFLAALRQVQERAPVRVEFHFMVGGSPGFMHVHTRKSVLAQLPGAKVHHTVPYPEYMRLLSACDVFANPFPFGNTNGIVDTVFLGLPGICLTGDEVHSHIDEGMFRRMGFPDFCIAKSVEAYVEGLGRLVADKELRESLAADIKSNRRDKLLYSGNPEAFVEAFSSIVES